MIIETNRIANLKLRSKQADRQAGRQADGLAGRQADRQTEILLLNYLSTESKSKSKFELNYLYMIIC